MEDSNQTHVERSFLREKLRDMQRNIKGTEDGDTMQNPTSGTFEQFRKENNELFQEAPYDRESALDDEIFDLLKNRAKNQVSKLIQLHARDEARIVTKLREKGASTGEAFGRVQDQKQVRVLMHLLSLHFSQVHSIRCTLKKH